MFNVEVSVFRFKYLLRNRNLDPLLFPVVHAMVVFRARNLKFLSLQRVMNLSFVFVRILENNEKEEHLTSEKGLRWYGKRLRIDEDGDVADEFFEEIVPDTPSSSEEHHHKQYPKFQLKYTTKPAKITSQALSTAGKIQHRVERQGKLEWI
ncbi:hypothetical protein T459_00843 [Capsicum annuum]|uniref:Uncharacterized protein n=1 Tax=Capsicum annuum TaxID=4072 RepID=A0A2G3AFD9_CAPAN|nr:hypothetical protein T459_00843 [Capsicum annuum]